MSFDSIGGVIAALVVLAAGACGGASGEADEEPLELLEILGVEPPVPVLQGSQVRVEGRGLDVLEAPLTLALSAEGLELALPLSSSEGSVAWFSFTAGALQRIGVGLHDVSASLRAGEHQSGSVPLTLDVSDSLPVSLLSAPSGRVHWNELIMLDGHGFVFPGEGALVAILDGFFTPDGGVARAARAELEVVPVERSARDRGAMVLSTSLGGVGAGVFEGSIALRSTLVGGSSSATDPIRVRCDFEPPVVFDIVPSTASVGQYLRVLGAGFVGGVGTNDATILVLDGTFTASDGSSSTGALELVPEFVDGSELRLVVEPAVREGRLVAAWVGARSGDFEGSVTVESVGAHESVVGLSTPLSFVIERPVQVIELRFLPGFDASLARFGLASARDAVVERAVSRVSEIFRLYRVDVRASPPEDFAPIGYSIVEIGGPDPNGKGLLGYDNSPGKDVGNLRLFDRIGGANAETQDDGFAGFGGVFIENFLYWSVEPGLPGPRPDGAPPEDPLFDQVFASVREVAASLAEVRGEAEDGARVDAVAEAIRVLGNMIGETAAHEIGHSLGLADPWGPSDVYHNPFDQPGCLMDGGIDRPFGERGNLDGFGRTKLCGPSELYLEQILGR